MLLVSKSSRLNDDKHILINFWIILKNDYKNFFLLLIPQFHQCCGWVSFVFLFMHKFNFERKKTFYFMLMLSQIPHQLVGVPLGFNITLECFTEAHPTSLNYWTREDGNMIHDNRKYRWGLSLYFLIFSNFTEYRKHTLKCYCCS